MEIDVGSIVAMMVLIIAQSNVKDQIKWHKTHSFNHLATWIRAALIPDCSIWLFQITLCLSARTAGGRAQFPAELHGKHEPRRNYQQTGKANLSIPNRKGMCTSAPISSPSLWRQEATSSAIPHRLNNSSRSTSLLHIKKQCATWVFEWAVERKQPVSCQGEHPEIISIIYHTDILQRGVRQGTISAWRLHLKGEKSRLARRGAASWFPRLVQTVQGK